MFTWLRSLYATPLRLIAAIMDVYTANHNRFKAFMTWPKVKVVFRVVVLVTAAAWVLIFVFADEGQGERLTEFFKELGTSSHKSEPRSPDMDAPSRTPD